MTLARCGFAVTGVVCSVLACGSQSHDEIPQELLDAIAKAGGQGDAYPAPPYGGEVGDVARNVCFDAWSDPRAAEFDPAALRRVCLADFYRSDAAEHRLLLINTAAIWCQACQTEYAGSGSRRSLNEEVRARWPDGLRALGGLFQDAAGRPASRQDAARWAQTFDVSFPFGVDPDFVLGAFANPELQPMNMLVDTTNMRILLKLQTDDPETLWQTVDEFLKR